MSVKVKICGITRSKDALAAVNAGADLIGLNFWAGTPRHVDIEQARKILDAVAGRVEPVAVFVNAGREEILETAGELGIRTVQLHGSESAEFCRRLEGLRVIKAFHVGTEDDIDRLKNFPASIYLLDAGGGAMPGGTGREIDWELAGRATRYGQILLAGGLTPDNVAEAVRIVEPWGVDTASGVEQAPGIKDRRKIEQFIRRAKEASGE
jgi:phosphoribosylanthranilate isomerase